MHPQNHHGVPVRGDNSANYWPPRNNSDSYHYCVPKTINYRTPQSNNDLAPPYQPNNFNSSGRHSYQTHTPTNQYGSTNFNYRASSSNNDSAPSYQHNRFNSSGRHSYQTNTPANNYVSAHSSSSKNISNHHQAPLFRNEQFSAPFTTKQPNDHVFSAPPPLNDSRPYTPFSNSTTSNSSGTQSPIPQENFHSNFKSNRDDIAAAFINANIEKINQRKTGTSNSSGTQSPIPQENFHLNSKSNSDDIAAAFINANWKRINRRTTGTTNSSSGIASRASINQNKSHKDEYQNCESKKSLDDEMLDFVSNNFLHLKKLPQSDSSEFIKRSPERRNHRRSRSRSRSNTRYSRTISKSPSPTHGTISRFHVHESFSNRNHKDDSKKTSRSRSRSGSRSRNKINRRRSQSPSLHLNVHPSQKYSKNDSRRSISKSRSRSPDCSKSAQNRRRKSRERQRQGTATVTEREELLLKYNKDYCPTITAFEEKIKNMNNDFEDDPEQMCWLRDTPSELYYRVPDPLQPNEKQSSKRLDKLCDDFEEALIKRADRIRSTLPKYEMPARKKKVNLAKHKCNHSAHSSDESSSSNSDGGNNSDEEDCTMQELLRKKSHPLRLHPELWFNDKGEMNDGPLCRCSAKASRSGIRHNIYAGENNLPKCTTNTNNFSKLYHYRMTISPPTNFLIKTPTIIPYDNHEYIFEGFSMFSHKKLDKLPACKVIRFNIEYTILYFDEETPKNFTIRELDIFHEYLFKELLELVDLDFKGAGGDPDRCSQFHFMPRFVRELPDNGKEILSMNEALIYFLENSSDLVKESDLARIPLMKQSDWEKEVDKVKGMIVTKPAMKPCALRIDQLDRDPVEGKTSPYPEIVHFGIRPPQLSYAGNPEYQKAWREYVKFRHLLANMPKPSYADKRKLEVKENQLQQMRTWTKMKRDVTITVNSEGFKKTGIMCDIVQHAMLIPVLVSHLRFHSSLDVLEDTIHYKFENRFLLQLALTHPSYRENFGTNPDHARNSLTNCGIRQPEYGDRRIHYMNTRKRGINTLINIMSRFGKRKVTESNITHNERLEFLGDAVVEFITSIHLFHMFPQLEEGGLATYRAAVVQNQHLAELAKTLKLDEYMLYAHGSDLCHELELRHAMANCFEALMGALFLDGGIEVADKVFGETFFSDEKLLDVWVNYPPHPLQEQEPVNDRHWISKFEILQKLTKFEELIGVNFTHIRLLARAFTDRSMGFTHLTLGSNQRLEFLGDTVLQLIASEYLYKYYPEHHEGHLSLLRSSLVNNRTQAVVCNDLGMTAYALYSNPKAELKTKDRADLLEAFLGALYIDKGMDYCKVFCNVCFFPRLQTSIMKQDWNDPKSKLQQCCLTLRTMEGGEPEIPVYKVIECMGPTNGREFTVAVYFKGRRLAKATGNSIQQAEMNSAKMALQQSHNLFPQLDHQKRVIAKSLSQRPPRRRNQTNKNSSLQNKIALTTTKRSANDH